MFKGRWTLCVLVKGDYVGKQSHYRQVQSFSTYSRRHKTTMLTIHTVTSDRILKELSTKYKNARRRYIERL